MTRLLYFWLLLLLVGIPVTSLAVQNAVPRVVVLAPHLVEIIFDIGAGDNIIGVSAYSDFPKAAAEIEQVSDAFSLNIERILELSPDHVIIWKGGTPNAQVETLKRHGLSIVESSISNPFQLADEIRRLGRLMNRPNQSSLKAEQVENYINQLQMTYRELTKPRIFYLMSSEPLMSAVEPAWPMQLLSLCNVENVLPTGVSDYPLVNLEKLLALEPDVIVVAVESLESSKIDKVTVAIPAPLRKTSVVTVVADNVHRMTARGIFELDAVCQSLNPYR